MSFRRGTLTDNQEKLWDEHWPRLGRVLADERIDVDEWFGRAGAPTILEIGSGTGTSTAAMAPLEADTNVIAVELYKRRLLQTGTLHLIATRLKPGGVLHVATDHAGYAEWITELVDTEPLLEYKGWPWAECPQLVDRQVITKFEGKGLEKDHTITEFLWQRTDAPADAPA